MVKDIEKFLLSKLTNKQKKIFVDKLVFIYYKIRQYMYQ